MKNLPLGYVCELNALLIHHKVYVEFQSHREIIQEISVKSEQVLAHFLFSSLLIKASKKLQ